MSQGLVQLLGTAFDGLTANSKGLSVTGQNIANVNTPGYARREVLLETRGQGLMGVNVAGLRRVSDAVIERRLKDALSDMLHWGEFEHVIVNDDFEAALERLAAVIAGREHGTRTSIPAVSRKIPARTAPGAPPEHRYVRFGIYVFDPSGEVGERPLP